MYERITFLQLYFAVCIWQYWISENDITLLYYIYMYMYMGVPKRLFSVNEQISMFSFKVYYVLSKKLSFIFVPMIPIGLISFFKQQKKD